jgi:hypothetical protein
MNLLCLVDRVVAAAAKVKRGPGVRQTDAGKAEKKSKGKGKVKGKGKGKAKDAVAAAVSSRAQAEHMLGLTVGADICSICQEKGHEADCCPDNPRNLYDAGKSAVCGCG